MADQQPGVWGIDIGQCALKAVRLELDEEQVSATAFDYVEHPKILSQPDADPDQLTRDALEKFLSRNTIRGDTVCISVPGQSGLARFVKLPPVEERKIPDIVRFEAKQQIPFPLDEVVWDYQKIGTGNVTDGFAMETEIGLFAIKRDMVNRALQQFKDVDVEVHAIQMAPLALCNFLAFDLLNKGGPGGGDADEEEKSKGAEKRCVVALDIGTDNSNLVITDGERIIWQRPIPFGGNHFTRALTKDLKLTFAKAEHLKRNATKSPDLKKILTSLKPVLNDFVNEVQRSLGYFTNTHRAAHVEYMVGLGNAFRLPGLQKFLSDKLQIDVRKLSKMERLAGEGITGAPAFSQNIMSFATAYGLAVQGLKLGRLQTNLLPKEIQFERMVRAKKPWAVAAAACLLLGLLGPTAYYATQYHAVAAAPILDAIQQSDPVVKKNSSDNSAYESHKGAVTAMEQAVRNVAAGQEERPNWVLLNEFINECLPSPGARMEGTFKSAQGNNYVITDRNGKDNTFSLNDTIPLAKSAQIDPRKDVKPGDEMGVIYYPINPENEDTYRTYWAQSKAAREAYVKLIERQSLGKGGGEAEGEGVDHLIQINVEAIVPMFCGDLKAYYDKLKADKPNLEYKRMLSEEEVKTPPEGKGWVVEVRGYTYHVNAYDFLLNTLQRNLRNIATQKDKLNAPATPATPEKGKPPAEPAKAPPAPAAPSPQLDKEKEWHKVLGKDASGKPRVGYVILYAYDSSHDSTQFTLVNTTVVASLTAGAPAGASGDVNAERGGMPVGPGSPVTGRGMGNWQPLASIGTGGTGGFGMGSMDERRKGSTDERRTSRPAPPPTVTSETGGLKVGTSATGTLPAATTAKNAGRTEFIMLFIWKEPGADKDDASGTTGTPNTNVQPTAPSTSAGRRG